jgi:rod shape-determining protein MreB and related proteins
MANIYAQISKNRIFFRNPETRTTFESTPSSPFTTTRLIVGEFHPFQHCMKEGIKAVVQPGLFAKRPLVILQAMELNEGGLSEIEKRILQEGALGAGAKSAIIHEGPALSDADIINLKVTL